LSDYIARLDAILSSTTKLFSTQNPKLSGPTFPFEKQAQDIRSSQIRQYSSKNGHGCVDSSTAIYNTVPNWETLMDDQTHPTDVLYEIEAEWWFNYMTSKSS